MSIAKLNLYKTHALFCYSFLIHATKLCHSEAWQGNPSTYIKKINTEIKLAAKLAKQISHTYLAMANELQQKLAIEHYKLLPTMLTN